MAHVQDPKKREQAAGAAKGPAKRLRTGGNVTAVVEGSTWGWPEFLQPPTEQPAAASPASTEPRAAAVAPHRAARRKPSRRKPAPRGHRLTDLTRNHLGRSYEPK
jgi:hypothetical protein